MNFKNFVDKYLHLIYEQHGNLKITLKEYKEFLKNSVKFDKNDIIVEEKFPLIDIPQEAINFLLNNVHKKIDGKIFKLYLKNSRHWQNIKNIQINDIFFDLFDFNDAEKIDSFNFKCFNISVDELDNARQYFNEFVRDINGFYNTFELSHIICINSNSNDVYQTLYHELSHFIQTVGNIRITNGINVDIVNKNNILFKIFNEKLENIISYFSDKEFIPHVDNIVYDLKKCKNQFYAEKTPLEFSSVLNNFLKIRNLENLSNNDLYVNFYNMKHGDVASLMMLLFSKISGYRFQKIMKIIEKNIF